MRRQLSAFHFFLKHASYSYDSQTETRIRGRIRCAQSLARAERDARDRGVTFEWELDDITNADHEDITEENPEYYLWACVARDACGRVFASLGAVDFGLNGDPYGNPYARVVEAELACELPDVEIVRSEN
jgi:hypothetical protein